MLKGLKNMYNSHIFESIHAKTLKVSLLKSVFCQSHDYPFLRASHG